MVQVLQSCFDLLLNACLIRLSRRQLIMKIRTYNRYLLHSCRDDADVVCLLLSACHGGTLDAALKQTAPPSGKAPSTKKGGGGAAGAHASRGRDEMYFSEDAIMSWFVQLLLVLHQLHQSHILHRDLKPANVFLSRNHQVVKLGDLGVAKQLGDSHDMAMTAIGGLHKQCCTVASCILYCSLGCIALYSLGRWTQGFAMSGMSSQCIANSNRATCV